MSDDVPAINVSSMLDRFAKMKRVSEEEAREYDWRNSIVPRLRAVGLPERFHQRITDWSRPAQQRAYEAVLAKCSPSGGVGAIVALIGPRGTGKTTVCGQMIVNATLHWWRTSKGFIPRYRKLTDILATLKPMYSDFGSRDPAALESTRDQLCAYEVLIIDEIHDCEEQRVKDRILTDILDRRYAGKVDTVLISNQTREDFMAHTNPSILSRINENGAVLFCNWKPWR